MWSSWALQPSWPPISRSSPSRCGWSHGNGAQRSLCAASSGLASPTAPILRLPKPRNLLAWALSSGRRVCGLPPPAAAPPRRLFTASCFTRLAGGHQRARRRQHHVCHRAGWPRGGHGGALPLRGRPGPPVWPVIRAEHTGRPAPDAAVGQPGRRSCWHARPPFGGAHTVPIRAADGAGAAAGGRGDRRHSGPGPAHAAAPCAALHHQAHVWPRHSAAGRPRRRPARCSNGAHAASARRRRPQRR